MTNKPTPPETKPGKTMTAREAMLSENRWMDLDMLCAAMGLSKRTAHRWRANGLPYSKPGGKLFFHLDRVNAWLKAQEVVLKPAKGKKG